MQHLIFTLRLTTLTWLIYVSLAFLPYCNKLARLLMTDTSAPSLLFPIRASPSEALLNVRLVEKLTHITKRTSLF
jgi:hypothetical protein